MSKLNKYMMVHKTPDIDCEEVQANWRKLAKVEAGTWLRTYYNEEIGVRYCIWLAPSEEDLKTFLLRLVSAGIPLYKWKRPYPISGVKNGMNIFKKRPWLIPLVTDERYVKCRKQFFCPAL